MAKLVLELDIEPALIDRITNAAKASKVSLTEYTEKLFRRDMGEPVAKGETVLFVIDEKSVNEQKNEITDPFLEKIKKIAIPDDIKAMTGILKGIVPDDVDLWEVKYEYLKERYEL